MNQLQINYEPIKKFVKVSKNCRISYLAIIIAAKLLTHLSGIFSFRWGGFLREISSLLLPVDNCICGSHAGAPGRGRYGE